MGLFANLFTYSNRASDPLDNDHGPDRHNHQLVVIDWVKVEVPVMLCVMIILVVLTKIGYSSLKKSIENVTWLRWIRNFPESCVILIVGLLLGLVVREVEIFESGPEIEEKEEKNNFTLYSESEEFFQTKSTFANILLTPEVFFIYILPPIIFDAGFDMPRDKFKENLRDILIYAIVGTLLNAFMIGFGLYGIEEWIGFGSSENLSLIVLLLFGAIISAVDPVAVIAVFDDIHVNIDLFILVLGESLLNDGVAVVLYHVFDDFVKLPQAPDSIDIGLAFASFAIIVIGGIAIGLVMGFLASFVTRFSYKVKSLEVLLILTIPYLSYWLADMLEFSSILSVVTCAFIMRSYVDRNLDHSTCEAIEIFTKNLATIMEMIIFILLGIVAVVLDWKNHFNWQLTLWTLFFCTVARPLVTVFLTWCINHWKMKRIPWKDQFIMSFSGLRGGIAFGLITLSSIDEASDADSKEMFIITTIVIIYFTNFIQGSLVGPIINFFQIEKEVKHEVVMVGQRVNEMMINSVVDGVDAICGAAAFNSMTTVHKFDTWWRKTFDPILIRDYQKKNDKFDLMYSDWKQAAGRDLFRMQSESSSVVDLTFTSVK